MRCQPARQGWRAGAKGREKVGRRLAGQGRAGQSKAGCLDWDQARLPDQRPGSRLSTATPPSPYGPRWPSSELPSDPNSSSKYSWLHPDRWPHGSGHTCESSPRNRPRTGTPQGPVSSGSHMPLAGSAEPQDWNWPLLVRTRSHAQGVRLRHSPSTRLRLDRRPLSLGATSWSRAKPRPNKAERRRYAQLAGHLTRHHLSRPRDICRARIRCHRHAPHWAGVSVNGAICTHPPCDGLPADLLLMLTRPLGWLLCVRCQHGHAPLRPPTFSPDNPLARPPTRAWYSQGTRLLTTRGHATPPGYAIGSTRFAVPLPPRPCHPRRQRGRRHSVRVPSHLCTHKLVLRPPSKVESQDAHPSLAPPPGHGASGLAAPPLPSARSTLRPYRPLPTALLPIYITVPVPIPLLATTLPEDDPSCLSFSNTFATLPDPPILHLSLTLLPAKHVPTLPSTTYFTRNINHEHRSWQNPPTSSRRWPQPSVRIPPACLSLPA